MIKPRIIVTGASGKTGSVVVVELLKAGYPVRALVHKENGRSAHLKAQGAEIAVADMSDVERVADALKDVQRAYFCPPFDPYMIQGAVARGLAPGARYHRRCQPCGVSPQESHFRHQPPSMGGISIGEGYANAIRFFRQHRIQLDRVGIGRRPIYLAGTPPPATGRSVAASAHPAQLPLRRVSI